MKYDMVVTIVLQTSYTGHMTYTLDALHAPGMINPYVPYVNNLSFDVSVAL